MGFFGGHTILLPHRQYSGGLWKFGRTRTDRAQQRGQSGPSAAEVTGDAICAQERAMSAMVYGLHHRHGTTFGFMIKLGLAAGGSTSGAWWVGGLGGVPFVRSSLGVPRSMPPITI